MLRISRLATVLFIVLACCFAAGGLKAQTLSLDLGPTGGATERALQLIALVTILSVAPAILIMVTSFTRIIVVLSLLRSAIGTASAPPNTFMLQHVREKDLTLFLDIAKEPVPASPEATPLTSLVPAFMISELRRAFEIGFLLFMPFLVIDLVVASILMSVGMMMLPPTTVSLPFKLIFFVLVDGWSLIAGSLVKSFAT